MTDAGHNRSVVVWDVPTALVCGKSFSVKLGVKCESGCSPKDWILELRNHEGERLAVVRLNDDYWPGTEALSGVEVSLVAPDVEGLFTWQVLARAVRPLAPGQADEVPGHDESGASFNLRTVAQADCRLTVTAIDRESQAPVAGAKVVVHPFRAVTDGHGNAVLDLPQGEYRLFVSGHDFFPFRLDGRLVEDTTIRAELDHDVGPSDAERWS